MRVCSIFGCLVLGLSVYVASTNDNGIGNKKREVLAVLDEIMELTSRSIQTMNGDDKKITDHQKDAETDQVADIESRGLKGGK